MHGLDESPLELKKRESLKRFISANFIPKVLVHLHNLLRTKPVEAHLHIDPN